MPKTDSPKLDGHCLALDLGTSSARALVLSPDLSPVPGALARHKITPAYGAGGSVTLDLHDYVEAAERASDRHQLHRAVVAMALDRRAVF